MKQICSLSGALDGYVSRMERVKTAEMEADALATLKDFKHPNLTRT